MDRPAHTGPRSPAAEGTSSPRGKTCAPDHLGSTQRSAPFGAFVDPLPRREFLQRTSLLGLATLVASALPLAERITAQDAYAADPTLDDATLQAFADTIIPGRKATNTDLGDPIHPQAIAGVDSEPGAVESDALRLYHDPLVGFDALEPAFLAELSLRALPLGGAFLTLPYDKRVQVVTAGFDFGNPTRLLWEAATAVPFTAFCAAAVHRFGNNRNASGYKVMGYPGGGPNEAPVMYPYSFGYRRRLAKGRTKKGYLP
jgi:hypothetical protein